MSQYSFSFTNYVKLLRIIKEKGTLMDYADINEKTTSFIILRHDVEFSPERALRLAEVEARENAHSSYFFQLTNNAYNTLSAKNKNILWIIKN